MSFIDVTVIRGLGDKQGEDIIEPLLTSEAAAVQRGRNEIDANHPILPTDLNVIYRSGVDVGQTVRVVDEALGAAWYGKISKVAVSVQGVETTLDIGVERVV